MSLTPHPFPLDAEQAKALTGGSWHGQSTNVVIRGATMDSRQVKPGMLFACFVGEQVDGHDYAETAVGDGAVLVLASRPVDVPVPCLVVEDVSRALGQLAAAFRQRYPAATWIGITGSNGKTTVKELVAAACGASGRVHATAGNYNNHIGLPLTVLSTPSDCRYVVIEMGASGGGDIDYLANIVKPEIGIITGIAPAHLEGFGDLLGVARGKSELFTHVRPDGRCLFSRHGLEEVCADAGIQVSVIRDIVVRAAGERQLTIVGAIGCPVSGRETSDGIELETPVGTVSLSLSGLHNLANACLAWHTAVAAGADPKQALTGLAAVRPASGRLHVHRLAQHTVFDDSYNANPASMEAGLSVLARQVGGRLAVLGGMGELGADSEALHARVGASAARLGIPLITVGSSGLAIGTGYRAAGGRDHEHAEDCDEAVGMLETRLAVGPLSVLVKASRSAGLEAVVEGIIDALGYGSGDGNGSGEYGGGGDPTPC